MEKKIIRDRGSVFCNSGAWKRIEDIIEELQPSKVFVLTDENTKVHCLPYFQKHYDNNGTLEILTVKAGENYKTIDSCTNLWNQLSNLGADRKSLLINLGGGVVTDLGGFVACTYQRGIEFINIPTSLLAMVDASVGGKNGVDLGVLKNQVGVIKNPKAVLVDTEFLKTLAREHFISGRAEMIKHGLIHSEEYLQKVMRFDIENTTDLVWESIVIKNDVISLDPFEHGLRKTLNYGHTLGHAIESYCLRSTEKEILLHGEAIAIGMILTTFISNRLVQFPKKKLHEVTAHILDIFGRVEFNKNDIDEVIKLMIFDKKNRNGKIQFVLLENIGSYKLDRTVPDTLIHDAFKFYNKY